MHALIEWLRSGDWRPTFEGVATFLTAVVALVAAWIAYRGIKKQIEADKENLQKQLDAEKQAREDAREGRRLSLSTALAYEIDSFYMRILKDRKEMYAGWKRLKSDPSGVEVFLTAFGNPLSVYEMSAGAVGDFDSRTARSVVVCYGALSHYLDLSRKYEQALTGPRATLARIVRPGLQQSVKTSAEQAVILARVTCENLCRIAQVDFSELFIAGEPAADKAATSALNIGGEGGAEQAPGE